ncbi:MAG: carboxypeptidase M32, partial [Chitinophagaceae bacterium]
IRARKENDFTIFQPELARMVELKKEETYILGFSHHPYDALLNEFEKGMTISRLNEIFADLKAGLSPLVRKIVSLPKVEYGFLKEHYSRDQQWTYGLHLLKEIGFDGEAGRQDISEHPFTTSFNHQDVRITTRIDESDLSNMIWGCLHEGGHALYEQGLRGEEYGLPGGEAASLGIHESQSRLWENGVGRGIYFWQKNYPDLQQLFPENLGKVSLEQFYKSINQVKPSLVRTEADELTYHFHVMIRYEIEKELISGTISTEDLREVWKERYADHLGLQVEGDKTGILQDIHWSHGSFGYFPTYSLGSLYAAQFFEKASQDLGQLQVQLANGENGDLLHWLRKNIHSKGRWLTSEELCHNITGQGLQCSFFLEAANRKYGELYGF